jgi:hypothetical protein
MNKPRIFLGSSSKQGKLLQSLARGLGEVAQVEPWTASFNPGTTTLGRLVELSHEVDFAAFVFARDDWTAASPAHDGNGAGQASPRDNVVFEAGLFGGVLGMQRTFILHANGAKLPSDLLGLTCIRYAEEMNAAEMRAINQKLRKVIENEGRLNGIEGLWWQFALTERNSAEPSAVSFLRISRSRRRPGNLRPRVAVRWRLVCALLERGHAREEESARHVLLLAGRTPPAHQCAAPGRHWRDPRRSARSRDGTFHHHLRRASAWGAHVGRVHPGRCRRPGHPGRT